MKKKVLLGQNPIVVQAAINVVNKMYEKLTDQEKMQLKQLDANEHKDVFFDNMKKLGDLIEQRNSNKS